MIVDLITLQRRVSSLLKLIELYHFSTLSAHKVIVFAYLGSVGYPNLLSQDLSSMICSLVILHTDWNSKIFKKSVSFYPTGFDYFPDYIAHHYRGFIYKPKIKRQNKSTISLGMWH